MLFDAVFEGGGAKGIAFAGALEVLLEQGHSLRRLIGTSAGAITAALCAAGYTPAEMLQAISERLPDGKPRFSSFMDIPRPESFPPETREKSLTMEVFQRIDLPFVPGPLESRADTRLLEVLVKDRIYARLFSFAECGGFYEGSVFRNWLAEKLAVKGVVAADTLASMFAKTNRDLSVVVSDTTDMEMLVLNHRTAPDVPVIWAVRMSMSIPFVWQEVVWKAAWGTYRGRRKEGNVVVDGGMLSNFPMRFIAARDNDVRAIMGDTDPDAAGNLGLLIDEDLCVPGAADDPRTPVGFTSLRTIQRVARLVDTMMRSGDNEMIRLHAASVCRVPAKGYGTLEFDMEGERLRLFLEGAKDAMRRHLADRELARTASASNP
jgi:predicted acylesterase/phospholipase RssA